MIYVLVFIQYMPTAMLKYYQIGPSYTTLEECEQERRKATENLIIHNSQAVACLEVAGN
jgi:hypothetical protein